MTLSLTSLRHVLSLFVAAGVALGLTTVSSLSQNAAIGEFEGHGDIGAPTLAGSATYDAAQQHTRSQPAA